MFLLLTSIAAPGATPFSIYEGTADPNGVLTPVAGPGALCVRNDAGNVGVYLNTATNVWLRIGSALGPLYPDNVPATFGTTSPAQGTIVYSVGVGRFELTTVDISAVAATQQTRPILIQTGVRTTTDANAGQVSGALSLLTGGTVQSGAAAGGLSGAWTGGSGTATQSAAGVGAGSGAVNLLSGVTDSTVGGGTGGPSGAVLVGSGNASATAGTSGATGNVSVRSGNSVSSSSGHVILQTGTAGTTRGSVQIIAPTIDTTSQATQRQLIDNTVNALQIGATGALNMLVFDTTNGAEELLVNAVSGIRTINGVGHVVGTSANDRFQFVYNGGANEAQINGTAITAGGATQATRGITIQTGARVKSDNNAGVPGSGGVKLISGSTDVTGGPGGVTGGPSGAAVVQSGNTDASVAGNTAGPTGAVTVQSGNSTASGGGTAGGTGAVQILTGNTSNGAAGTGAINLTTGNATAGAGNSGSIIFTIGTSAGGVVGTIQAIGRLTTTDGVGGGTVRTVGGLAFSTTADSGTITGNGAFQTFNQSYSIPGSTLKAGSTIRVQGCVRRTGINAADTAQVQIRLGATVYVISTAVAAANGDRCYFDAILTARGAPGGAVQVVGVGAAGWSTAAAAQTPTGGTANLATNGALTLDVQINMPNNGANTAVLEQLVVDVV